MTSQAGRPSAQTIRARKGQSFPVVTVYDAAFARCVEEAGIDCVLVGDSLGMVVLGYESTTAVDLTDMLRHTAAVARGSSSLHIIADLPMGSFESDDATAVNSAIALIKAGAGAVKLEGGARIAPRIRAIVNAGIPVVGHLGVLPQTASLVSGFRAQRGHTDLLADARAVCDAGAYACVLEMVVAEIADELTRTLVIPTIGIGSGPACDAQILVMHDILGLYRQPPPFARRYVDLAAAARDGFAAFAADVRAKKYPLEREA